MKEKKILIASSLQTIKKNIEYLMCEEIDLYINNKCMIETLAKMHCCLTRPDNCTKCFDNKNKLEK